MFSLCSALLCVHTVVIKMSSSFNNPQIPTVTNTNYNTGHCLGRGHEILRQYRVFEFSVCFFFLKSVFWWRRVRGCELGTVVHREEMQNIAIYSILVGFIVNVKRQSHFHNICDICKAQCDVNSAAVLSTLVIKCLRG